jgi:hypothetical protein
LAPDIFSKNIIFSGVYKFRFRRRLRSAHRLYKTQPATSPLLIRSHADIHHLPFLSSEKYSEITRGKRYCHGASHLIYWSPLNPLPPMQFSHAKAISNKALLAGGRGGGGGGEGKDYNTSVLVRVR